MGEKTDIELSIAIAAHNEGILANKTLSSLRKALDNCDARGIAYEVIATLDNPTPETEAYFLKQQIISPIRTISVHEGDLSRNRMAGLKAAKGKYLAIIDADDLCSSEWFVRALEICKANEGVIVHTEYSVNFGTMDILWKKSDSVDINLDAIYNVQANRWDSALVAERELLVKYGFRPNEDGFGSEDWDLNMRTLADGVKHLVAPQTALFVRRKESGSELDKQRLQKRIVRPSALLALDRFRSMPAELLQPSSEEVALASDLVGGAIAAVKRVYQPIAHNSSTVKRIGAVIKRVSGYDSYRHHKLGERYPNWLLDEWKKAHLIEKLLFPSDETLEKMIVYRSENKEFGRIYWQMAQATRYDRYDYVLFVPYLNKGGADLVAIRYANTLQRLDPSMKICVVATVNIQSEWASKLDSKIDFISFGEMTRGMDLAVRVEILGRFITNISPKKLHIINSKVAYRLVSTYSQYVLANDIDVYVCAFCEDINEEGRVQGYIHEELPNVYSITKRIFTDNKTVIKTLSDEYGYDVDKFRCHYIPVDAEKSIDHTYEKRKKLLWASRISYQKQPRLLREISSMLHDELPDVTIEVFGSYDNNVRRDVLDGLANVSYKGTFNGLYSIELNDYDAMLYTALYDGIPNIILETANAHLPLITSLAGGIGELCVDGETAMTVSDPTDARGYVEAIKRFYRLDSAGHEKLAASLYEKLRTKHTQEWFDSHVKSDVLDS